MMSLSFVSSKLVVILTTNSSLMEKQNSHLLILLVAVVHLVVTISFGFNLVELRCVLGGEREAPLGSYVVATRHQD